MKKVLSATGAIGYVLISGFIITLLLLAIVEIGKDRMEDGERAVLYAAME